MVAQPADTADTRWEGLEDLSLASIDCRHYGIYSQHIRTKAGQKKLSSF